MKKEVVIEIKNLKKRYRMGQIGGGTLTADLQSWWAKIRKREDPNSKLGQERLNGETFWALNGINLSVRNGEAVGIIGINGAGKSTLLKVLSQITAPTEGEITIKGKITSMLEVGTGFNGEMTGRENIYLNGAILGMTKKEVDSKIDDIIEFSECGDFIDTPVKRYSSGMYVKLAFSVAAHLDSNIMIMDEVLAVGDVKFQQKCLNKMSDESRHNEKTVLYVSHNMSTIRQLCTRCVVLKEGKVIYDGDVESAIAVYIENNKTNYQPKIDLKKLKRPSFDHGKKIVMEEIEFIESIDGIYNINKPMVFKLSWKSLINQENIFVRIRINAMDGTTVGLCESPNLGNAVEGYIVDNLLQFDVKNLTDGSYTFNLDLYTKNEHGFYSSFDHIIYNFPFAVDRVEDGSIIWNSNHWNYTKFDQMEIIDEKNN